MTAPTSVSSKSAADSSHSLVASLQARVNGYLDLCLLAACALTGGIFYGILVSPALANVRRTYVELGHGGQLACAATFVVGLILVLLSFFWALVYLTMAWQSRPKRLAAQAQIALQAGLDEAQQQAEALYTKMLADMRREGGSEQDIAQAHALIESVSKKVGVDAGRQAEKSAANPAALEAEVRALVRRLDGGEVIESGFKRV